MVIGVPKEIKDHEFRVALTPHGVKELCGRGHRVVVQEGAGEGSGFGDDLYRQAGAVLVPTAQGTYEDAHLIVKVKEPQSEEWSYLRKDHVLFTYLHLAASKALTEALLRIGCAAIAYETTEDTKGQFPLLYPMSEIAGQMSVQIGAHFLEKQHGGSGVMLGGVAGVPPGEVVVLGSGVVGASAVKIALGMGAKVTVLSLDIWQLRMLDDRYPGRLVTVASNQSMIHHFLTCADLVIGAVYLPAARTPRLITRSMLSDMKPGSVLVDVSVDQGGCAETTRPTTHTDPVYAVDGVLHYAVANIPGIVPYTSTLALTNATLPFIVQLVEEGLEGCLRNNPGLRNGLSVFHGRVTCQAVADAHGLPYDLLPFSQ
ncbi:MAG TPA: alanine dehydrogenase [Nitrospirales bacterium]|nr:alanine dehydrogenase [Nitrospiraceae bacterium]HNP28008.1 alanine dehydrogenase [Nitrospirales bacterium]